MISHSFAQHQTYLPVANVEQANQFAPQYNAVSWALAQGRGKAFYGEPITATLVLVAYAQHAEAALFSGNGYSVTQMTEVKSLLGLSLSTIRTHTNTLVRKGVLVARDGGFRIPEAAFNAEWIN